MFDFEQGPIRPPSEAGSLLVRLSRNCPWNKCAFCPVYKGAGFSTRSVDEVLVDLDLMKDTYGDRPTTVFLQDANPLVTKPDHVITILEGIRQRFPNVSRITTYARSHTLALRKPEDLRRIREAGLDRVHIGLESGNNEVLALVEKGTTQAQQIDGGRGAVSAGFEVSEYWMPGLGGREFSEAHADDSAAALCAIQPHFIRLRSTAVVPGTPLAELEKSGRWTPLTEVETVQEIRRFLTGLAGVTSRLESDHSLNLLMELRGDLPDDLDQLIAICDRFLKMAPDEQELFILARRLGRVWSLEEMSKPGLHAGLERIRDKFHEEGLTVEQASAALKLRMI